MRDAEERKTYAIPGAPAFQVARKCNAWRQRSAVDAAVAARTDAATPDRLRTAQGPSSKPLTCHSSQNNCMHASLSVPDNASLASTLCYPVALGFSRSRDIHVTFRASGAQSCNRGGHERADVASGVVRCCHEDLIISASARKSSHYSCMLRWRERAYQVSKKYAPFRRHLSNRFFLVLSCLGPLRLPR